MSTFSDFFPKRVTSSFWLRRAYKKYFEISLTRYSRIVNHDAWKLWNSCQKFTDKNFKNIKNTRFNSDQITFEFLDRKNLSFTKRQPESMINIAQSNWQGKDEMCFFTQIWFWPGKLTQMILKYLTERVLKVKA